jgi:uncharacterized protein (UPF0332 family)
MMDFWSKAEAAARAAHLLIKAGDTDGAVNRAYYAMFDAARTALGAVDPALAEAKTHASILRRFSKHIVKEKGTNPLLGRFLNKAADARFTADYEEEPIDAAAAGEILANMDAFLAEVGKLLRKERS